MKFQVRLLFAGFIVSFLLAGVLSALSFLRFKKLNDRVAKVEHSIVVTNIVGLLREHFNTADKGTFRFLVSRDSGHLQTFYEAEALMQQATDSLKMLTADNEEQQRNIVILQSDEAIYLADCRTLQSMPYLPAPEIYRSQAMIRNKSLQTKVSRQITIMAGIERRLLAERTEARAYDLQLTTSLMKWLSVIFSLLTLLLFVLLLREFRRRISFQNELQLKLTEIAQSKKELEHIAYATSHDLQEPLRKIRILTDKWQNRRGAGQDGEDRQLMERVVASAARMQDLVGELMILSSLNDDKTKVPCSLHQYAASAVEVQQAVIDRKSATVSIGLLPVVQGYPDQLRLLFKSLLDNALKFSKPGEPLEVSISARTADGSELSHSIGVGMSYHCVIIEDNGLGFDNRQADKMFGIFRQLHGTGDGYTGKGTGLAICQRIMHNHSGAILAHGFVGKGATFKLYFPVSA